MADPFGDSIGANIASHPLIMALMYVIAAAKAVKICRKEAAELRQRLENIKPDVERLENVNQELEKGGVKGDPAGTGKWLADLRVQLLAAWTTLGNCKKRRACTRFFKGPATALELTELRKKFEELATQIIIINTGVMILVTVRNVSQDALRGNKKLMEMLATNYNPRPQLPAADPLLFLGVEWHEDMAVIRCRVSRESAPSPAAWHANGAQAAPYPPVPPATQFQQQQLPHCHAYSGYARPW